MNRQVLSGSCEDWVDAGRRASGELPSPAPLETPQSPGPVVQEPARHTGASDQFAAAAERDRRLVGLVHAEYRFLWRTLRRLGVAEAELDKALEEVFLVAQRRLDGVSEDRERAFLLGLGVRVASTRCGGVERRREQSEGSLGEPADPVAAPTDRARALLDEVLGSMALKSRTAFVLFELEGLGLLEIAELLEIPVDTVGSRVRRARESFRRAAARYQPSALRPEGRP